MTNPLVTFS